MRQNARIHFLGSLGLSETAAALSLGRGGTHARGANIDIRLEVSRLKHWGKYDDRYSSQ
jgi:hypothetical protein